MTSRYVVWLFKINLVMQNVVMHMSWNNKETVLPSKQRNIQKKNR